MPLETGRAAPPFALLDADGARVALDDFKGRWLVAFFYPKDDTPG
jgi:thioredoxin-dependent peroxiredoxin